MLYLLQEKDRNRPPPPYPGARNVRRARRLLQSSSYERVSAGFFAVYCMYVSTVFQLVANPMLGASQVGSQKPCLSSFTVATVL